MCVQSLNSVEDAADVNAASRVQAELALLSDISNESEVNNKSLPSTPRVHRTSPSASLSQVSASVGSGVIF